MEHGQNIRFWERGSEEYLNAKAAICAREIKSLVEKLESCTDEKEKLEVQLKIESLKNSFREEARDSYKSLF